MALRHQMFWCIHLQSQTSKAEDTRGQKPAPIFDSDFRSRWKICVGFRLENRRRFSTPKTDVVKKRWRRCCIYRNHAFILLQIGTKRIENGVEMYLHQFCTVYKQAKRKQRTLTSRNCLYRSLAKNRPRNRTRSNRNRKPAPIFGVENRSRFCMTHVPKFGSDFWLENRCWFSTPCVLA